MYMMQVMRTKLKVEVSSKIAHQMNCEKDKISFIFCITCADTKISGMRGMY
jgi:hypothetical protein